MNEFTRMEHIVEAVEKHGNVGRLVEIIRGRPNKEDLHVFEFWSCNTTMLKEKYETLPEEAKHREHAWIRKSVDGTATQSNEHWECACGEAYKRFHARYVTERGYFAGGQIVVGIKNGLQITFPVKHIPLADDYEHEKNGRVFDGL